MTVFWGGWQRGIVLAVRMEAAGSEVIWLLAPFHWTMVGSLPNVSSYATGYQLRRKDSVYSMDYCLSHLSKGPVEKRVADMVRMA